MKKVITLIMLVLFWTASISQTVVSGNVTGVWNIGGSPYIVSGDIFIVDSLTIDPGVNIKFNGGGYSINVGLGARLHAVGTCQNKIVFEPLTGSNPGSWTGIIISESGVDDTLMFCEIMYADYGVRLSTENNNSVLNSYISNCVIHDCKNSGILATTSSGSDSSFIFNCEIYNNGEYGVEVHSSNPFYYTTSVNKVYMYKNTVFKNGYGGIKTRTDGDWECTAYCEIINNSIVFNDSNGIVFENANYILHPGTPHGIVMNSITAFNKGEGIRVYNTNSMTISGVSYNCFWNNNSGNFSGLSGTGFGQTGAYLNGNSDSCDVNFNIYYNPQFVDTSANDYRLALGVKCIDAGTNIIFGSIELDPDSTIPDMGGFPSCNSFITSIKENDLKNIYSDKLVIYPNPCSGKCSVWFPGIVKNGTIRVHSVTGSYVYSERIINSSYSEINLENVTPGIYFVEYSDASRYYCKKLILE